MRSTTDRAADLLDVLDRLDTYLVHVTERHAAGLAWNGFALSMDRLVEPLPGPLRPARGRPDPVAELGVPRLADRQAVRRDVHCTRRLLGSLAAQMRFGCEQCPVTLSIADGLLVARGAVWVRDMRDRMLAETLTRLRRVRRDVMRRTEAVGSVDIRLDTWGAVGDARRASVRAYLDGVLQQQADYASYGRGSLGRLVELRTALDLACERVDARLSGGGPVRHRSDSGPLVISTVTPPEGDAPPASATPGRSC